MAINLEFAYADVNERAKHLNEWKKKTKWFVRGKYNYLSILLNQPDFY